MRAGLECSQKDAGSPSHISRHRPLALWCLSTYSEALKTCQHAPSADWSREAYLLVGHNDIAQMTTSEGEVDPFTFSEGYQLKDNDNLVSSYRMLHISHHVDVIRGENRSPKQ